VSVIEVRDSVVFCVAQTVLSTFDINCAYLSHLHYRKPSYILPYTRPSFVWFE